MSKKHRDRDADAEDLTWELESKLEPGMLRFLAHVMENGLQAGLRTQHDFIRHFTPRDIMQGLADRPDLRANILVPTTGVRPKIALKKSAESAGEDLQIALEEGETDAELIVSLFHPDDRVRYLDNARLWNYIIEPKFWMTEKKDGVAFERAKSHMAFIIDRAIEDRLLTFRDIVEGITVGTMVQYLPPTELQSVIERALSHSHSSKPFSEQDLITAVPSVRLVEHIPHSLIWDKVICPKIAEKKDLAGSNRSSASASTSTNNGERHYDGYGSGSGYGSDSDGHEHTVNAAA
jgi:hypothetical protein